MICISTAFDKTDLLLNKLLYSINANLLSILHVVFICYYKIIIQVNVLFSAQIKACLNLQYNAASP